MSENNRVQPLVYISVLSRERDAVAMASLFLCSDIRSLIYSRGIYSKLYVTSIEVFPSLLPYDNGDRKGKPRLGLPFSFAIIRNVWYILSVLSSINKVL